MNNNKLSGIERDLVLQYLIDGNVPVTLTLINTEEQEGDKIKPLSSQIFPIALKADHMTVCKNGTIQLKNPPQSVVQFANKTVKVEFYFNRIGLYFNSLVKETKKGLSLEIPKEIDRIQDVIEEKSYDFSALLYFECGNKKDINISCVPCDYSPLFTRPAWKEIPLENQQKAKDYLEKFVAQAKAEKNAGNGIQLIPVCNFLTMKSDAKLEAIQGRAKPLNILYVDHERIVFGFENENQINKFEINQEYGLKMSFSLKKGPIISRDIFVTSIVNKLYSNEDGTRTCIDFKYTTIQEEDLRYLYEKATSSLFI